MVQAYLHDSVLRRRYGAGFWNSGCGTRGDTDGRDSEDSPVTLPLRARSSRATASSSHTAPAQSSSPRPISHHSPCAARRSSSPGVSDPGARAGATSVRAGHPPRSLPVPLPSRVCEWAECRRSCASGGRADSCSVQGKICERVRAHLAGPSCRARAIRC